MRAAAAPADAPTPCPLCTHLNTHSLTHRVAARLRPLLARFSPMVSRLPPCPRLRVLWPYRHSSRWIVVLAAAALFMVSVCVWGGGVGVVGVVVVMCVGVCVLSLIHI